jgi:hypothetical protein
VGAGVGVGEGVRAGAGESTGVGVIKNNSSMINVHFDKDIN